MLLYNGEIYNFKKLEELKHLGHQFKTNGDTEAFKIICRMGKFLNKLEGMFAFVFGMKKKKILLARINLVKNPFLLFSDKIGFFFLQK